MGRRANGEGSVYQEASGRWVAAVTLPGGRRKKVRADTRAEALVKRREILRALEDGLPVSTRRPGTLGAWIEEEWFGRTLPARVKASTMKPETLDSYRDNWRLHIAPDLGDLRWDKLTPGAVRAWQAGLLDKPSGRQRKAKPGEPAPPVKTLSQRTVQYCHSILRAALNDAIRDEVPGLRRNVVELVKPPRVSKASKGRALTVEEIAAIIAAIEDDPWRLLWLTYLALGLRRGEGLALRWSRLDLERGVVPIAKTLKRRRTDEVSPSGRRRGELVEDSPKTEDSEATVAIPAALVEEFKRHRREQKVRRLAARVWADPDLVFSTSVGTPIEPRNVNRAWGRVLAKAKVAPCRPHDLRHSFATVMLREGEDLKKVQRALRHSRFATTADIYSHVMEDMQRGGAAKMDDFLRGFGVGQ